MKRYGSVVEIKADALEKYKRLHAATWPEVLAMNSRCNIRNYSIFLRRLPDGKYYLFSYFEYVGTDYDADMALLASNPVVQEWWDVCKPCHEPLPDRPAGEWWAPMEEVFHQD
jgi:L-rhamnose mutarotase